MNSFLGTAMNACDVSRIRELERQITRARMLDPITDEARKTVADFIMASLLELQKLKSIPPQGTSPRHNTISTINSVLGESKP